MGYAFPGASSGTIPQESTASIAVSIRSAAAAIIRGRNSTGASSVTTAQASSARRSTSPFPCPGDRSTNG